MAHPVLQGPGGQRVRVCLAGGGGGDEVDDKNDDPPDRSTDHVIPLTNRGQRPWAGRISRKCQTTKRSGGGRLAAGATKVSNRYATVVPLSLNISLMHHQAIGWQSTVVSLDRALARRYFRRGIPSRDRSDY